ncbi:MAG: P-loop ATPase, Sll1717 family [Candidatus Acidiferrales bacterium]
MIVSDQFRFRKHASIGAAAAEEDTKFLAECFVDTGDLETLKDSRDRRRIVLGRTGAGKTALLGRLIEETNAIVISPETLSFNYLTNSTVLQFFLEAGVKLDLFFKLLWRHVLTVELLKSRYSLNSRADTESFLGRIKSMLVKDRHKERAVDYLLQWGEQFWEDTEYRIKEITQRVENDLAASVSTTVPIAQLKVGGSAKLSQEDKTEVIQRGKKVINSIQMRELTDVLTFLNEDVFADEDECSYLCIDRLDENWVDESFRYLLIRSLIETIRDFLQVRNVKIVAALRTDLIERVFRFTRDAGFQEEKYRSLYLPLRWTKQQLLTVLDRRVNYLVRQTYTKQTVGYAELLPSKLEGGNPVDFLLDRTLMRPRDLIEFFNNIIELAAEHPNITRDVVFQGEGVYSRNRLRSLQDEWITDYPALIECSALLKQQTETFRLDAMGRERVEEFCLNYAISHYNWTDLLSVQARAVADGVLSWEGFLCSIMHVFYLTGIVGLKTERYETYEWAHQGPSSIVADTINLQTSVSIHPMFHRVLGVRVSRKSRH